MNLFPSSSSFLATFTFPLVQACAVPHISQLPPEWRPEPDAASLECAGPGILIGDCRDGATIEAFDRVVVRSVGWGPEYRIAPGHHSLTVSFVLFSLTGIAKAHSLGFQDLEFDAVPGHRYLLCAAVRSAGWTPRIVDRSATTGSPRSCKTDGTHCANTASRCIATLPRYGRSPGRSVPSKASRIAYSRPTGAISEPA